MCCGPFPLKAFYSITFIISSLPKYRMYLRNTEASHKRTFCINEMVKSDMARMCIQKAEQWCHWFLVIKVKINGLMHFSLSKNILWVFHLIHSTLKSNGPLSKWSFISIGLIKNVFPHCQVHLSELQLAREHTDTSCPAQKVWWKKFVWGGWSIYFCLCSASHVQS